MGFAAFAQGAAGGLMQGWEDNREAAKAKAKEAFALSLEQSKQDAQRDQTTREIAARSDQQIMEGEAQMELQRAKDAAQMGREREGNASAERVASIKAGAVKPGDYKSEHPIYWKHYDDIADASSALDTWYSEQVPLGGEPSKAVVNQYKDQRKRLMDRRVALEKAFVNENPSGIWDQSAYDAAEAAGLPTDAPAGADTDKGGVDAEQEALNKASPEHRTSLIKARKDVEATEAKYTADTDRIMDEAENESWKGLQAGGAGQFGRVERGGGEARFKMRKSRQLQQADTEQRGDGKAFLVDEYKRYKLQQLQRITTDKRSSPEQRARAFALYQQLTGVTLDDNP